MKYCLDRDSYEKAFKFKGKNEQALLEEIKFCVDNQCYHLTYLIELFSIYADSHENGVPFLLSILKSNIRFDINIASIEAISGHRNLIDDHKCAFFEILVTLLRKSQKASILPHVIDALSNYELSSQKVSPFLSHRSPYVVGAALRFLAKKRVKDIFHILLDHLSSKSYIVRMNAIDELEELGNREAVPFLEELLNDKNSFVRSAAKSAVQLLKK